MRVRSIGRAIPLLCVVSGAACLLGSRYSSLAQGRKTGEELRELYIVGVGDVHFYPYWASNILHALPENGGVLVRGLLIEGATTPCDQPSVRAVELHLKTFFLKDLVGRVDLCSLDPEEATAAAVKLVREPDMYESSRVGIVVRCGTGEKVFRLPEFQMDTLALQRRAPRVSPLLQLEDNILKRAGTTPATFWGDSLSAELGDRLVPELRAGRFDHGFWFCSGGEPPGLPDRIRVGRLDPEFGSYCDLQKFRNVLATYKGPAIGVRGQVGELEDASGYQLLRYVPPLFPPLAVQARIEGAVVVEVAADPQTGSVKEAIVVSGHPLLKEGALDAVRQWRFDPAQGLETIMRVKLEFKLHCDGPKAEP